MRVMSYTPAALSSFSYFSYKTIVINAVKKSYFVSFNVIANLFLDYSLDVVTTLKSSKMADEEDDPAKIECKIDN